jgi:VIT1/CCC1 family predicted Fe2+/Mn2+ transporter
MSVHFVLRPSRLSTQSLAAGSIREVVFGVEDGVVQNMALVAGMVGAQLSASVVVLAASINAIAGVLSMSMGTYLSSKAEHDVAIASGAIETNGHSPRRDAIVMAAAYAIGALVPIVPFVVGIRTDAAALIVAMLLTGAALFALGALKAVLSGQHLVRAGVEMLVFASAAGLAGYAIGMLAEAVFGFDP